MAIAKTTGEGDSWLYPERPCCCDEILEGKGGFGGGG